MIATVVGTVLVTLVACYCMGAGVALYIQRKVKPVETPAELREGRADIIEGRIGALEGSLAAVKIELEGLPVIWKDERERTKNHADRSVAALRSVEEVMEALGAEEEDGSEDPDLHDDDGEGVGLMSPLFGDVAGASKRASEESDVRERARRHLAALG